MFGKGQGGMEGQKDRKPWLNFRMSPLKFSQALERSP